MKRELKWSMFGVVCLFAFLLPRVRTLGTAGDLEHLQIKRYHQEPLLPRDWGCMLVLELSASSKTHEMSVFAKQFLLIGVTGDGFMQSIGPEAILRCNGPLQCPSFSSSLSHDGHITLSNGKGDFRLCFYLTPEVTPTQLHYLGGKHLVCLVPSALKLQVTHARLQ